MAQFTDEQPAYILHRRDYRESSYLLDIYTLNCGRISVVAKGAKAGKGSGRASHSWPGLLQLFQPLMLSWFGRSNLKTLTLAEAPSAGFNFVSDRLFCAYYLNELLMKLTPEAEGNSVLFSGYADALQGLKDKNHTEVVLRNFELTLLQSTGLAPDFWIDSASQNIVSGKQYCLNPEQGFTLVKNTDNTLRSGLEFDRQQKVFDGKTILTMAQKKLGQNESHYENEVEYKKMLRETKHIMRILIAYALQGKELQSRTLFEQLKRGPKRD